MSTVNNITMINEEKTHIQESKKRSLHSEELSAIHNDDNEDVKKKLVKFERIKKKNYALMLGYLGKNYYGMQRNPQMKTIEEDLINAMLKAKLIDEEAFATIQNTNFQRAARTDKGVSANRQICSVKLPEYATKENINAFLPKQIRVFGLKRVTKGFNSKSNCNARTYTYTLPTYALAPEDTSNIASNDSDEEYEKRIEQLHIINGKPFHEYRVTPEVIERLNSILKLYEGTHNFHNFTCKVRPFDPRAMRYMIKCHCDTTYVSQNMEFAKILIKGQSFMLHQIRKMIALAIGIVRNLTTEDKIHEAFTHNKLDIPIAPGLGLVLDHVHYDNYDRRYGSDGIHEKLLWDECEEEVQRFHKEFISRHIEETEINEKSMLMWLGELSRIKFAQKLDIPKISSIGSTAMVEEEDEDNEREEEQEENEHKKVMQ
ncbi:tRNA pseudouridine synthase A isoform X2 [Chelonus insularis]|nr:tRNA pseudouridine synthase A isoform X2 [Chelonus insularis]XP_034939399.1 tRNA pseudouridine synthase A isoform X2 [Chelonus insularis]